MKRKIIGPCLVIGVLALVIVSALAQIKNEPTPPADPPQPQWGKNGLEICNSLGNTPQQNPKVISSEDGYILTAWEDGRFGYTNIYAQKLDSDGNRLWTEEGLPVCIAAGNQNSPAIVSDGSGGLIVVWQDYRHGNADIFAQHLDARGEPLWSRTGIIVCKAAAGQFSPQLVSDGVGGAIITWHDYRSGTGEDIYAQRISRDGAALWKADGLAVSEAPGTQWYPKIARDGAGGAIIAWADGRLSSSDNNIYAQRLDPAGKPLWDKDGIPVCAAPQNQERPEIVESRPGAVIAWQDSRNGNVDIYAQKVDLDGKMIWEKDGLAACTAPFSQDTLRLAADGLGGAVIAWADNREEESAIYLQRISANGKTNWGDECRTTARSPAKQENPEVLKLKTPDWLVVWEDFRSGNARLFAQKINGAGIPIWAESGVPLAAGPKNQGKAACALAQSGDVVIAWQDRRGGNYDIFAQKLSPEGAPAWAESGQVVCNAPGSVIHQNPSMINDGKGNSILVFEDARSGYLNIYAQKVDPYGNLLWGKDSIPVAKVKADQANPQLVSDGAGGAIVAWEDARDPACSKIYAQRLGYNGKKIWENGSLPLTRINAQQSGLLLAPDGKGGAIIVWQDERNVLSLKDLYGQRVSGQGELLWDKNGFALCSENGEQAEAALIPDGTGGVIFAWTDYRRGDRNPDIYAQRVNIGGKPLWQKDGVIVCGAPDIQRSPRMIGDGERGALIAWTDKGGGSYDIYAQRLNADGRPLWLTDGIPVNQAARTQQNPLLARPMFILWEDYRYGNWDLFANTLSPEGKLLWGEEGVTLSSLPLTQYAPQAIAWKNGSFIVAWEDYRNGSQYELYMQLVNAEGKTAWTNNGLMVRTANGARAPLLLAQPKDDSFVVAWEDYTGGGKAIFGQKFKVY